MNDVEYHPLKPFLPQNAQILMLGSFPPPQNRWSIDFFYPNYINDMWRILGLIFFDNKNYFVIESEKKFNKSLIIKFCNQIGIAIFDTASAVCRLQNNASDKFLDVVIETDLQRLFEQIPLCKNVVTTGEKATDTIVSKYNCEKPKIGASVFFSVGKEFYNFYRMPSSSRAYPLSLEKKAEFYRKMFNEIGLI